MWLALVVYLTMHIIMSARAYRFIISPHHNKSYHVIQPTVTSHLYTKIPKCLKKWKPICHLAPSPISHLQLFDRSPADEPRQFLRCHGDGSNHLRNGMMRGWIVCAVYGVRGSEARQRALYLLMRGRYPPVVPDGLNTRGFFHVNPGLRGLGSNIQELL